MTVDDLEDQLMAALGLKEALECRHTQQAIGLIVTFATQRPVVQIHSGK